MSWSEPLNSDSFLRCSSEPTDKERVRSATQSMFESKIPQLALEIRKHVKAIGVYGMWRLVELVHQHGVNLRHLAHVRAALQHCKACDDQANGSTNDPESAKATDAAIALVSIEMLARATKNLFRREIQQACKASAGDTSSLVERLSRTACSVVRLILSDDSAFLERGVMSEIGTTFSSVQSKADGSVQRIGSARELRASYALYLYRVCELADIRLDVELFAQCFPSLVLQRDDDGELHVPDMLELLAYRQAPVITKCEAHHVVVGIGLRSYSSVFRLKADQYKATAIRLSGINVEELNTAKVVQLSSVDTGAVVRQLTATTECRRLLRTALAAYDRAVLSNSFEMRSISAREVLTQFLWPDRVAELVHSQTAEYFTRKDLEPSHRYSQALQLSLEHAVISAISEPLQRAAAVFNSGAVQEGANLFEDVLRVGWRVLQRWYLQPAYSRRLGTVLEDLADVYLQAGRIHGAAGAFMMCMRQIEPLDNFARDIHSIIRCRRMAGFLFHKLGFITEALYWKVYELRLAVSLGDQAIYDCLIGLIPVYLVWMNSPVYVYP